MIIPYNLNKVIYFIMHFFVSLIIIEKNVHTLVYYI